MSLLWKVPLATALVVLTLVVIYLCLLNPVGFIVLGIVVAVLYLTVYCSEGLLQDIANEWKDDTDD